MASPQWVPSVSTRPDTSLAAIASAESGLPGAAPLRRTFVDLGMSPLCESYVPARRLSSMEPFYPQGERTAGYGAPGKGNTLLNYCGIRTDLLEFTVDRNPYKQGQFLPGTHIPIRHPEALEQERPDYILILPWNLKQEIVEQLAHAREWGARFVVPIPQMEVL
jgi:hypothetical protein